MKKLISLQLLLLLASFAYAQRIDSLWTAPFDFEVLQLVIAPDGTLISRVLDNTSVTILKDQHSFLAGIDPNTGAVKWKFPAAITKETKFVEGISFVPNSPFIVPTGAGVPLAIINPDDGKVLVDAFKEGITEVEDYGLLLESGHAWVTGKTDKEKSLSVFDLRTGKKLYSNHEYFKEKSKAAAKFNKFASLAGAPTLGAKDGGEIRMLCKPINNGKDRMIIATTQGIYDVNISNGEIGWEAELPDPNKGKAIKVEQGMSSVRLMPGRGETFFVIKPTFMVAMNYSDGKPAWKDLVKTSGPIDQIIYDQNGLILCPGSANSSGVFASGYLKLVDEKTGKELWDDGIKFSGGTVKNYLYTEKGLAIAMVNLSSQKNAINFIDVAAGKFILPKNVNVDGDLQYLELTPKGLLYKTDREINIIGLETDKPLMQLPVQSKKDGAILSANGTDHIYFYSTDDKSIYDINKTEGTAKVLNKAKIDFKSGEEPSALDLRKDGLLVYSFQNATLTGFDGTTKYNVYNPGVRTFSGVMKKIGAGASVLNDVLTVAGGMIAADQLSKATVQLSGVLTPAQQATLKNDFSLAQAAYATVGTASFITGMVNFKNVKTRASASAQSNNMIYMMTKVDDRSSLLGINKDSGTAVSKVLLAKRDNEPLYELDTESGYLYYAPKGQGLMDWLKGKNAVTGYKTPGE
jgi:hypothetical protein